jgi:chromosome segregation ATPase
MDKKVAEKTKEFDSVMAQVQEKTGKQDEIAGHRANERLIDHLKVSEDKYQERKAGLENFEGSMDARDREYDRKNKDMDKIVDNQSDSRVDVTTKELQGKYDARKSSLDSRESDLKVRQDTLDRKKTDMPNLIKQEGDVHYAKREGELKDELSGVEKGLQKDLDGHKQTLQSEYKQKEGQYNSEYSSKKSVVDGKESRVNSMRQDVSHKETQIRDTENKARHNEQEAESILSSIPMEKGRYLDEANRARNEASSLRGQVSGAQSSLSSAQSSANSAQSDYQRSASEFNQLQSDINSLQNQIANAIK